MIQEHIYTKEITRPINGVIKAGSENDLDNEITEFVITAEQMSLLPKFFKGIEPQKELPCVWISGDFGSGKSHLLKILSYVLENKREIEGKKYAEIFAEKAADDFELAADITRLCRIPTQSVLFNIQEKLDGITKSSIDPVLTIFIKEFNRKLGYDDKKPEIAQIERYFDEKGKLDYLHTEYKKRFGKEWVEDRPAILLKQQNLAAIFADMEGTTQEVALMNIKTQIQNYRLDTNSFAKLVNDYLDKQPDRQTRLFFFVDEVGQFIGKDEHRMLSLQTIAEALAVGTGGRSLVAVTSQMDIDAAVGNLEKQQSYDFSRIQGRFTTRINLTSANSDEVIQRRLLEKKEEPQKLLCEEYRKQKNIIKSLFNFGETSQFKNTYKDEDDFAISFPFVNYQFNLLQNAIIELSKNNAFTGQQQSVGERSMLTITQEVAIKYKDKDLKHIVQFSDMYEGLRGILQTKIQTDIQQAERTLDDELALKVLKTLFLVKYVKGFPSTLDNITKIMLPTFDADFISYKSDIQEALNKLVRTSYIEKAANDEYHYQTNEEKDIETEIKHEDLRPEATNDELKKMFRDEIFSDSKIKLSPLKIFTYGRIIDEQQDGRDADFYIHFITPLTNMPNTSKENMTAYSMQHTNQLCVVLDEDKYLAEDLVMFKKADKCLVRLLSRNDDSYRQQIISDKRRVNSRRRENIVARLTELTKKAHLYMGGMELNITPTDLKTRLTEGMQQLVAQVYINLKMLAIDYDDAMLKEIINSTHGSGFGGYTLDGCTTEVLNKIKLDKSRAVRSKVKDLVDYFRTNNYGWYEMATLCLLAKLYKMDMVSFRYNGSPVDDRQLYLHLTNSTYQAQVIVEVEETISQSQITKLKSFYKDLFDDEACVGTTAKEVHTAFINRLKKEREKIEELTMNHSFEFIKPLNGFISSLKKQEGKLYPGLYSAANQLENLIDEKLDDVEPISEFVHSPQFAIFQQIDQVEKGNQANLSYASNEKCDTIKTIYTDAQPWKMMPKAKQLLDDIRQEIETRQKEATQKVLSLIETKQKAIEQLPQYGSMSEAYRTQIQILFKVLVDKAKSERYIGNLIAMEQQVSVAEQKSIETVNRWVNEEKERQQKPNPTPAGGGDCTPLPTPTHKVKTVVQKTTAMKVDFAKPRLETSEDVEQYVDALRTKLMHYIKEEKYIMLN